METLTCRLLPHAIADGPHNMAADEVLLHSAAQGQPSLRFYGWSVPTISLGYFQPCAGRLDDPLLAGLPFVRRPTGGDALVHHHELTYCLAISCSSFRRVKTSWLRMHDVIGDALADLGVETHPHVPGREESFSGFLCFQHRTAGDLLIGASKVVGSAQRRQRDGIMQHGGILLARSPHTPALPGIRELCGVHLDIASLCKAIVRRLEQGTNWGIEAGEWSEEERRFIDELAHRYADDGWNRKR